LEYDAEAAPASGLGLFIGEAHQLLRQLQTVVLREQAARFMERVSRCWQCGSRLGIKDSKTIVYRTVYGKAHLDSPRLYSTCGRCGAHATPARSFSPLAEALPERTHPQWLWLQSRYAAVMSYRQAQTFLRDAFPAGRSLPVSSMKVNVRHTGQRLEAEVQLVARTFVHRPRRSRRPAVEQQPAQGPQIELAVDAGYIRALPEKQGVRSLAVVASKLVQPVACHGYTHAYVGSSDPHQGVREQTLWGLARNGGASPTRRVARSGKGALTQDDAEAFKWYRKATG
jgi:hypothetical protein